MARIVLHLENLERIDTTDAMRKIAEDVAEDARRFAAKGRTLGLSRGISVIEVRNNHAVIQSVARNPRSSPEHAAYPLWVERGTSDTRAEPFLRPAAYRYRTLR